MSLTLKIGSLFIRTAAKPIANAIKRNAREHERFRRLCVSFAQRLHRIDMRLRLGLLQDPAVIDRQIAREVAEAEAKRKKLLAQSQGPAVPTVPTEAEAKASAEASAKLKQEVSKEVKSKSAAAQPKIRPLSESKAIETGANFISEAFMFMVAVSIIGFESWRSRRKESSRREDVQDRLDRLEAEKEDLRQQVQALLAKSIPDQNENQPAVPKQTAALKVGKEAVESGAMNKVVQLPTSPKEVNNEKG